MKIKQITLGITAAILLSSSVIVFAADEAPKTDAPKAASSSKKPHGKLTCEDFVAIDDVIKPQYVIAAVAYTKGGKAKDAVIEVVETDTLVPVLIEECQKAPKESFWAKLKDKLKHL
jgi:acid stress chaperone HdeA